jgi:radical SAM protein with 4Fe4S-binding SPASM domain
MTTAEIRGLLHQLADAGAFFLALSGGEALVRRDCFEIIESARSLRFNVKLKTNAVLIREKEAQRLLELGVEQVQISVYSHRPEVHDAITKVPGSLKRTLAGIRLLRSQGMKVTVANVLMRRNRGDSEGVRALALAVGAVYKLDPTITPMMDGNTSVLSHRVDASDLSSFFHNPNLVGDVDEFCAPPVPVDDSIREGLPCSAGHTSCYISPYGDVYPCVQFPLPCGNVRTQQFLDIWRNSPQLAEVRSIRGKHLPTCSSCAHLGSCTRCPGLAYMEGNMRGPSTVDCEKSFVRTGIVTAGMLARKAAEAPAPGLVQISAVPSFGA